MLLRSSRTGHDIAPDTAANAPIKFSVLETKTQKLVAKLATKTIPYILTLCTVKSNSKSFKAGLGFDTDLSSTTLRSCDAFINTLETIYLNILPAFKFTGHSLKLPE